MADETKDDKYLPVSKGSVEIKLSDGSSVKAKVFEPLKDESEAEITWNMEFIKDDEVGRYYRSPDGREWLYTKNGRDYRMQLIRDEKGKPYPGS